MEGLVEFFSSFQALTTLAELKSRKASLESEIQKYKDNDPDVLDALGKETRLAEESANRWTDNIFAIHSWIGKKFPSISVTDLNKQFGIPDDLDYV